MAVYCDHVGDGLTRDAGTFIDFTNPWSMCLWVWLDADVVSGEEVVLWHYGDITGTNDYIRLSVVYNSGPKLRLTVKSTTASTSDSTSAFRSGAWVWLGMRRSNAGTGFTVHWDGGEDTLVKGNPSLVETDEYLGTDTVSSKPGVRFAYVRHFQVNALAASTVWNERSDYAAFGLSAGAANAALADTPLPDTSDLADDSGNARDWTAVGTLVNADHGPLDFNDNDYEGSVFEDTFDNENSFFMYLPKWSATINSVSVRRVGCGRTNALACDAGQIVRGFPAGYTSLTFRCQIWPSISGAAEANFATILGPPRATLAGFQALLYVNGTGAVMVRLTGPSGSLFFTSDTGLINPANGVGHSVQAEVYCNDDEQRVVYYLDNEEVLDTGTVSTSGLVAGKWRRISRILANPGNSSFGSAAFAIDNVQAEPGINVIPWTPCLSLPHTTCSPVTIDPDDPGGWHAWFTLRHSQPD